MYRPCLHAFTFLVTPVYLSRYWMSSTGCSCPSSRGSTSGVNRNSRPSTPSTLSNHFRYAPEKPRPLLFNRRLYLVELKQVFCKHLVLLKCVTFLRTFSFIEQMFQRFRLGCPLECLSFFPPRKLTVLTKHGFERVREKIDAFSAGLLLRP